MVWLMEALKTKENETTKEKKLTTKVEKSEKKKKMLERKRLFVQFVVVKKLLKIMKGLK